jgi:hypothetical protein
MQKVGEKNRKMNRISLRRNGRSINVLIEGRFALLVCGMIALAYVVYLFQ